MFICMFIWVSQLSLKSRVPALDQFLLFTDYYHFDINTMKGLKTDEILSVSFLECQYWQC